MRFLQRYTKLFVPFDNNEKQGSYQEKYGVFPKKYPPDYNNQPNHDYLVFSLSTETIVAESFLGSQGRKSFDTIKIRGP